MIALIAGTGTLPIEAAKALIAAEEPFLVIALFPEDNLGALQHSIPARIPLIAQKFYKASKILALLKEHAVRKVLFIGKVDKRHLLSHIKLDLLAIRMLASLVYKGDRQIMERILEELAQHGIEVIKQDIVLKALRIPPGVLTGKRTSALDEDLSLGFATACALSQYDVGQTVVIKNKMVLAVEAIEGTDACIKRGIVLGKNGIVICKAAHKNHNQKYDLPTLGANSLAYVKPGEIAAIAWDADHTLIADKEAFITRAQELGITLISYSL